MLTEPGSEGRPVHPYVPTAHASAVRDFREARRAATIERILARLRGRSADLLCYSQVRELLGPLSSQDSVPKTVRLDAIIGSVERCADYTRGFLPAQDHDQQRWTDVRQHMESGRIVEPIDLLQIGHVYFVIDGHHRVSVTRQRRQAHIDARVTQIETRVPLTPDLQPDEFGLRTEYAAFLERTRLDETHPHVDLVVTLTNLYPAIEAQIEDYAGYLQVEHGKVLSLAEAAGPWYEQVYLPRLQRLREIKILTEFPSRTDTDLYVSVCQHRTNLEGALGREVELEHAATDLVRQAGTRPRRRLGRASERIRDRVMPDGLQSGPSTGTWRRQQESKARQDLPGGDCLFRNILVPCGGNVRDWAAVAQAAELACREGAQLTGLHVAATEEEAVGEPVRAMQAQFEQHCRTVGIQGSLRVEVGQIARQVCERSRWADLVVLGLAHPPVASLSARLTSGLCAVVRRCPTPVLAVPGTFSALNRPLLAYDGSPKAREALYVATYLAARGEAPLTVVSVAQDHLDTQAALDEARAYLERHSVAAAYLEAPGPVAPALLQMAKERDIDLILMGGYGHSPLREVVLGSAVDEVLRGSESPVFICR